MGAADVGGTFTDLVVVENGEITTSKIPTTTIQSEGVALGLGGLVKGERCAALLHGTTVATNALLERDGARTALVTDEGFEDIIEIARQDRPSLYDSFADRSEPLVPRDLRIGVASGDAVPELGSVDAVAVAFVDGHIDTAREARIGDLIRGRYPRLDVSFSSVVAPEFREYERTSTTVLNAYLSPVTSAYLGALAESIVNAGLAESVAVMRSSGGLMSVDAAAALPAAVLLSGPAGGVVAAQAIAGRLGYQAVISFDMGGTSTDVCRIDEGVVDVSYERSIDGYACRLPAVGIHTVGAGGGSIAWVDSGGSLRVGPRSAGAEPGPMAYGRGGTEPTVTDANVVLGRIDPGASFGGSVDIDVEKAFEGVALIGSQVGLSPKEAALGIVRIAEDVMAGAARTVSVEQGADPRIAHLVAFGGAGGLHASAVARTLGMRGVLVPQHAGVFSALGLLLAPPRADEVVAVHMVGSDLSEGIQAAAVLVDRASSHLERAGHRPERVLVQVDARYVGQAHEIAVSWSPGNEDMAAIRERFEQAHTTLRGFARQDDPIEVVAIRCAAIGGAPASLADLSTAPVSDETPHTHRTVVAGDGRDVEAAVVQRQSLSAGETLAGPAIIEEAEATTFIDVDERLSVAFDGTIELSW